MQDQPPTEFDSSVIDSTIEEELAPALKDYINCSEDTEIVRVNHEKTPGLLGVFKTTLPDQTDRENTELPTYYLVVTDRDNPVITVEPHTDKCSACDDNEVYTREPGTEITEAKVNTQTHNCIHANTAQNGVHLGTDGEIVGGEACPKCGKWAYVKHKNRKQTENGHSSFTFTKYKCGNCDHVRNRK